MCNGANPMVSPIKRKREAAKINGGFGAKCCWVEEAHDTEITQMSLNLFNSYIASLLLLAGAVVAFALADSVADAVSDAVSDAVF